MTVSPSARVVDQRLRNRIVEALQVFAAGDEGVRAAGYVEFFELFFDYVDGDPRRGLPWRSNTALTPGEVEALNGVLSVVLAAVEETSGLVGDDVLIRSGWPTRIMRTAAPALALMEGRGRFNEDAEEEEPSRPAFPDDMSDISEGRSRRSPHEKKQMSLARDGRNSYFANDKASRKNIPRAKARVNRANRRADTVALSDAIGATDNELAAAAEEAVEGRRRKVWRKWPDEPLRRKLARRKGTDGDLPFDGSQHGWH